MTANAALKKINPLYLNKAINYNAYVEEFEKLVREGKTSGDNQSISLIEYTKLNLRRMKRIQKTSKLNDELESLLKESKKDITFLVLSEAWCGDAAQNLPLFHLMEQKAKWLTFKVLYRDENLDLIDAFLTNGGRSIPKLIAIDNSSLEILGTWGPRPQKAQEMVIHFKKIPNGNYEDFTKEIQLWYAKDKTQSQQGEMLALLKKWTA